VKVLFDHNLPHKLRTNLDMVGKHEIVTASYFPINFLLIAGVF